MISGKIEELKVDKKLYEMAKTAYENAYAPYSKFKVGCALSTSGGQYFIGANVENVSYGGTICAERVAISSAITSGVLAENITEILILTDKEELTMPCGICRQVMVELMSKDAEIIVVNFKGDVKIFSLEEILPFSFDKF